MAVVTDLRTEAMLMAERHDAGHGVVLLKMHPEMVVKPNAPWIEHACRAGDGRPILNAVALHPDHKVSGGWPEITVSPSIACPCGLHGFLREGVWVPV